MFISFSFICLLLEEGCALEQGGGEEKRWMYNSWWPRNLE